ncbi:hypothetical protein [Viscerimonas tarda]
MNKTIWVICIAVAFGCSPLFLSAYNSGEKGISAEEKASLEKRFQGLGNFYIDDDGAVVFQQTTENVETPQAKAKIKVSVNEYGEYVVTSEEPATEYSDSAPPATISYGEKLEPVIESVSELAVVNDAVDYQNIQPAAISTASVNDPKEVVESNKKKVETPTKSASTKRETSYKSMEEAILDVDQLIEELKKQSSQANKGKAPLSQKVSGSVDGSLRNKSYNFKDLDDSSEEEVVVENGDAENDGLPTYYINNIVSTKKDVDNLKKSDILKKVIKRSKSNPNGEWRIETKQK